MGRSEIPFILKRGMGILSLLPYSLLLFLIIPAADAEPKVKVNIEKVAEHKLLVTFSWKVAIMSDKAWDACDLILSFRDKDGREIYNLRERLKLKIGDNAYGGHEICSREVWERTEKYLARLDCVF